MSTVPPEAVIVSAVRSPIGRAGDGSLAGVRADDLLAAVVEAALARVPELDPTGVDELIAGWASQEGGPGANIARIAALLLGWDHLPGVTVNRFCASSLQAIRQAAQAVRCGDASVVIAGGVESSSLRSSEPGGAENPVFAEAGERSAAAAQGGGRAWTDPRLRGELPDPYIAAGLAAENVADRYGITRADMDAYAAQSQRRALEAAARGLHEMMPVKAPGGRKVQADDCPRAGVTAGSLSALPPLFRPDGRVTAGNSAPASDGAAAVIVMSAELAAIRGIEPLARIRATAVSALSPELEGPSPVAATRAALARAGMSLADIDVVTTNEPFAAQVLAYCSDLGLDPARVNAPGGSIALGEPQGATGARLAATTLETLRHSGTGTALVTLSARGGQGMAMVLEAP
ncbi:acetyl-CoA C-acyltransferase [Actinocorallia longicatena]|uniref:Acetyl-CoA C-acetyltransferase n=1 Tax=Actinocorallia longicatena TaxID=111803 RepID=A0ABP6QNB3_9ACTN